MQVCNIKKIVENVIIIIFFLAVLAFPWTAYFLGVENNLKGADDKVELSFKNLDEYIIQNFPGREILVRTKNQFLYSYFDISPNNSIAKVGDNLISTETLNYYHHGLHRTDDTKIDTLISKLKKLSEICDRTNKKFVVITTPTKPRYYDGVLPFADDVILAYQGNYGRKSYDILKEKLYKTDLNYFDCVDYIDSHKDEILGGNIPLFYDTAHHWSNYKGNLVGLGLIKYLRDKVKLKFPEIKVVATPCETAMYPDSDLFDILNIYDEPNIQFYEPVISFDNFDNDDFNFLIQGGSFLGGLLFPYSTLGMTNKIYHIENKACLYDHYSKDLTFTDYDDLDRKINLVKQLKDFNVVILEINELNVYNASFGFLDYLLEHEGDM